MKLTAFTVAERYRNRFHLGKEVVLTVDVTNNPAVVAKEFMLRLVETSGMEIDEQSFDDVATIVGDVDAPGFIVDELADLGRLCKLGKFEIVVCRDGIIRARIAASGNVCGWRRCSASLEGKRADARYCSKSCRNQASRRRVSEESVIRAPKLSKAQKAELWRQVRDK